MIGTLTWHFHNRVVSCNEEDTCVHAIYKENGIIWIEKVQQKNMIIII